MHRNVFCLVFIFIYSYSSQKRVGLLRLDEQFALLPCPAPESSKHGWDGGAGAW